MAGSIDLRERCPVQLLVHGTVPEASGLSSSSSLVVAVSLAILAAYGCQLVQPHVAEFTATCERHIGVASGGMDQAISVMGRLGVFLHCVPEPCTACSSLLVLW
jgi:N-acetylgalactosamine kinase